MGWTQADLNAANARLAKKPAVPADAVEEESQLHYDIIDECTRRGWAYLHGSMVKKTARTLGEVDFTILGDRGRVWFIEAKSKTGKLRQTQIIFKAHAEHLGHKVHVVHNMQEFFQAIAQ